MGFCICIYCTKLYQCVWSRAVYEIFHRHGKYNCLFNLSIIFALRPISFLLKACTYSKRFLMLKHDCLLWLFIIVFVLLVRSPFFISNHMNYYKALLNRAFGYPFKFWRFQAIATLYSCINVDSGNCIQNQKF